jgi:amino acid permease
MLGLILLYWIGKYFYKLAEEYDNHKWGYAILGIVIYYGGTFFFGIILVFVIEFFSPGFVDTIDDRVLGFMALPFGVLSCFMAYKYFEKTWKKNYQNPMDLLDEIGKPEE